MKSPSSPLSFLALLAFGANAQQLPPVRYVDGAPACPTDLDLRNIDTRLSARVIPPDNQRALQAEKMKANGCRQIGGRYADDNWKRLRAVLRGES